MAKTGVGTKAEEESQHAVGQGTVRPEDGESRNRRHDGGQESITRKRSMPSRAADRSLNLSPGSGVAALDSDSACVVAGRLLSCLFHSIDTRDYRSAVDCFGPDGSWNRQNKLLAGRGAILDALNERSPTLTTLHVVSNVTPLGGSEIAFYLTVYRSDPGKTPKLPLPLKGPALVGMSHMTLAQVDGHWLIGSLVTGPYLFALSE